MPRELTPEQKAAAQADYVKALEAQKGEGYAPYANLTSTIQTVATDFDKLSSRAERFAQHDNPFAASPNERAGLFAAALQDTYIQAAIERRAQDYPEGGVKTDSHGHQLENTHAVIKDFVDREIENDKAGRPSTQEGDIEARLRASNEIVKHYEGYGKRIGNIDHSDHTRIALVEGVENGDSSAQRQLRTIIREEATALKANENSLTNRADLDKLAIARTIEGIGIELSEGRGLTDVEIANLNRELNGALRDYANLMRESLENKAKDGERKLTGTEEDIVGFAKNEVKMCAAYLEGVRGNPEAFNPLVEGLKDRLIDESKGVVLVQDEADEINEVLEVTGGEVKVVVEGTLRNKEVVISEAGLAKTRVLQGEAEEKLREEKSELGFITAEVANKKNIKDAAELELQGHTDVLESINESLDKVDQNDAAEIKRLEDLQKDAEEKVKEAADKLSQAEDEFNASEANRLQQQQVVENQERVFLDLKDKVTRLQESRARLALKAVQIDDNELRNALDGFDKFVGIRMSRFEDLPANLLNAYSSFRRGEVPQGLPTEIVQRLKVLRQNRGLTKALADIQSLGKGEGQAAADKRVKRYFKQIHHMTHEQALADARGYNVEEVTSEDLVQKIIGGLGVDNSKILINDLKLKAKVKRLTPEARIEKFAEALRKKSRGDLDDLIKKYFDENGLRKELRAVGPGDKLVEKVWGGPWWKKAAVSLAVAGIAGYSIPEAGTKLFTQAENILSDWRAFLDFEKTNTILNLPVFRDLNFSPSVVMAATALLGAVGFGKGLLNLISEGNRAKDFNNDVRTFVHLTVPGVVTALAMNLQEKWMQTASKTTVDGLTYYLEPASGFQFWKLAGLGAVTFMTFVGSKSLLEMVYDRKVGLNDVDVPWEKTTMYKWQQWVKKRFSSKS